MAGWTRRLGFLLSWRRLTGLSIVLVMAVSLAFGPVVKAQTARDAENRAAINNGWLQWVTDPSSCVPGSGGPFSSGSGDGYTLAAPNLKDPAKLADAINQYIEERFPNSPFKGMGNLFVSGAMRAGINPLTVVFHAVKESQMGTARDPQVLNAFNAFGRTATSSQPHIPGPLAAGWYKYPSWEASLDGGGATQDHPSYMKEVFVDDLGYNISSLEYIKSYLGESPAANAAYTAQMLELMNDFITKRAPDAFAAPGTPPANFSLDENSGGTCPTAGSSGQVVDGLTLPLDKQFFDQHPEFYTKGHHDYPAADLGIPSGTNVYSMSSGKVISAPNGGACGQGVTIDAGNGIQFVYCHGSDGGQIDGARVGDTVQPGQLIMHSDNTGRSTGPHLHVGLNINGVKSCPQTVFQNIRDGRPTDFGAVPSSGCISGRL